MGIIKLCRLLGVVKKVEKFLKTRPQDVEKAKELAGKVTDLLTELKRMEYELKEITKEIKGLLDKLKEIK